LGGSGIIGTHVSRCALDNSFQVYSLSRRGKLSIEHKNLKIIKGDINNLEPLKIVIHGLVFDAIIDLLSFNADQLRRTVDFFQNRMSQYVVVSSATIHKSTASELITEDTERIAEGWNYPLRKIRMEEVLTDIAVGQDWAYTIVRPYITYSEQRLPAAEFELPDICERIQTGRPLLIGDEILNTVTTVTHASDLAKGIIGLIGNMKARNTTFNITSDETHTWKEIIDEIGNNLGKAPIYASVKIDKVRNLFPNLSGKINDRMQTRCFDTQKIKQAVPNFSCDYNLAKGFKDVFPKNTPYSSPLTQAILDRLTLKIDKRAYKPAIAAYKKNLWKRKGLKNRLNAVFYFVPIPYKTILATKHFLSWVRSFTTNHCG
jgi:nucleoside-diphosphate-sugar epimerase